MPMTSLCYIRHGDEVLMMHRTKKRDDVNAGKWIGVGGKFLPDESPDECVRREVMEETGLSPERFLYCGVVTFLYNDAPAEYMHVYLAESCETTLAPCAEGDLAWIPVREVESLRLWPGDRIFLPLVLRETRGFSLKLRYADDALVEAILNGEALPLGES